ncbi:MAG: hypothetical protein ACP5H3_02250 [Candidatus Aenigmatarchaeota archaeon]
MEERYVFRQLFDPLNETLIYVFISSKVNLQLYEKIVEKSSRIPKEAKVYIITNEIDLPSNLSNKLREVGIIIDDLKFANKEEALEKFRKYYGLKLKTKSNL